MNFVVYCSFNENFRQILTRKRPSRTSTAQPGQNGDQPAQKPEVQPIQPLKPVKPGLAQEQAGEESQQSKNF